MENKRVKILIKNVTGDPDNDRCIDELSKSGAGVGSIQDGIYFESNNSVQFEIGSRNCTAWVGETCEIIKKY